jgi:hypothetical protein
MSQSVRIWKKGSLNLGDISFQQREMVEIGSTGLLSVFKRVTQAQGPNDGPAKPLSKRYAMYKSRLGKGNRRNLILTGQLLGSLKLRTVTENRAYSAPDARMRVENRAARKKNKAIPRFTNRDVGMANMKREPWLVFSPSNVSAVFAKAKEVFARVIQRIPK